jgi:hypothetical protein
VANEIQGEGFVATYDEEAKTLTIVVDLGRKGVPSGSGKTMVVATTRGNRQIDGQTFFGLNVFRYTTPKGGR